MSETNGAAEYEPPKDQREWPPEIRAKGYPPFRIPDLRKEREGFIKQAQELSKEEQKLYKEAARLQLLAQNLQQKQLELRAKAGDYDGYISLCKRRNEEMQAMGVPSSA